MCLGLRFAFNGGESHNHMRPKVVLLILVFGAGILVLAGILHGLVGRQSADSPPPPPGEGLAESSPGASDTAQLGAASAVDTGAASGARSIIATTPAEERAALRDKDLEAISDALLSTEEDGSAVSVVASRLENADAEVRVAARDAAVHLGDTNIIPYLAVALERISDPREKVELMDAIQFLQLPSGADVEMPEGADVVPPNMNVGRLGATNATRGVAPQSQPRQPVPRRSRATPTPPPQSP